MAAIGHRNPHGVVVVTVPSGVYRWDQLFHWVSFHRTRVRQPETVYPLTPAENTEAGAIREVGRLLAKT